MVKRPALPLAEGESRLGKGRAAPLFFLKKKKNRLPLPAAFPWRVEHVACFTQARLMSLFFSFPSSASSPRESSEAGGKGKRKALSPLLFLTPRPGRSTSRAAGCPLARRSEVLRPKTLKDMKGTRCAGSSPARGVLGKARRRFLLGLEDPI